MKPVLPRFIQMLRQGRSQQNDSPMIPAIEKPRHMPLLRTEKMELAQKYTGKLLSRTEIHLNDQQFTTLLSNRYFTPVKAIEVYLNKILCKRCHNNDPNLFGLIPCARCNQTHTYCRNCIRMGRIMECEYLYYWSGPAFSWPKHEHALTWRGKRTEAQEKAAKKIVDTVENGGELLIWAVTGSGKTEMIFPGINRALQLGKRVCIATPRTDVVRELLPRIQEAFQSIHIQALYSGSKDKDGTAQIILSTTHQLLRYRHAFDVLIIDEIDAFPYHQDNSLHFAANRSVKAKSARIYLTATPRKQQKRQIATRKLPYVFVPLRYHGFPLPVPKTIYCAKLKRKLSEQMMPTPFVDWLQHRQKRSRQLLIFVPTIQLAERLQQLITDICKKHNIIKKRSEVKSVHAEDKQRANNITLFRKRQITVLITTTILERGVTFPEIDVVVLDAGHEVFDEAALVQIAGRAGRSPNDPTGEVIFFHEGKTNAIVDAIAAIKQMNRRGEKIRISR